MPDFFQASLIRSGLMAAFLTASCIPFAASAADLHVAPSGDDRNDGSRLSPMKTLSAVRDAVRKIAGKEAVTVHVADGVYYLPEPLVFSAQDSGSERFPIVYQAATEGGVVLSGGARLNLDWQQGGAGVFSAKTPSGLVIDQLFIDGKRQRMARYPNYDPAKKTAAYQGFSADAFSKERAARWSDPKGGFIHAMHAARWGGYHYRITGKNKDGEVTFEGGWQNNRQMGMHKEFRMVENVFEELDAPGEWFHDAAKNTLFFKPEDGMDLSSAVVEVVRLRHLVEFSGNSKNPVRNIGFKGFVFRHAARTFMDTKEPLLRSDWAIYRGGAMLLRGTEDVSIEDCRFDQVGGNAVFVNRYNRRVWIKGCHINDAGASGVCFVGDPSAVRSPLFEYGQSQNLAEIDLQRGPKSDDYPADSVVEDCLIQGIGRVERQPAGVQISMSMGITVRDTTIHDCARAGINISEGTWGGHLIERCDVFDTVLETHDHGSFNSWGRDRFWTSNHRGVSQPAVMKNPELPFLDVIKPIVIRDSRWRCDHGWDIDLDDGSSNYEIYNNLMLHGGLKFREGYGRKAYNNILVNSGFHPHVWFENSASSFQRNIVMKAHAPIGQPANWGAEVNHNFFSSPADLKKHRDSGADADSLAGDPGFLDPAKGDFRVKEDSDAIRVGFKNFPMDQFGVKKAALKAIAGKPEIPSLEQPRSEHTGAGDVPLRQYWLGALLHGLVGEEFSAFGVAKEVGGVQLVEVPAGSAAARAGFMTNDLVQGIDSKPVSNVPRLLAALLNQGAKPIKVRIIRNQKGQDLLVRPAYGTFSETAADAGGFAGIKPGAPSTIVVSARGKTNNDPLSTLCDGALSKSYGPVFSNGDGNGAYRIDLGKARAITAANAWSFNMNGNRGRQWITLYGSASSTEPGWNTADPKVFMPIGTIDTGAPGKTGGFVASSIRSLDGGTLGDFRWLLWEALPVTDLGENTSFQELGVEASR